MNFDLKKRTRDDMRLLSQLLKPQNTGVCKFMVNYLSIRG